MKITGRAVAGTLESSDVFVEISPGDGGIALEVESVVYSRYGESIEESIRDVLATFGVEQVSVRVQDRGALDCTIRARVETALRRAQQGGEAK